MNTVLLQPAMASPLRPDWPGACWIGTVDETILRSSEPHGLVRCAGSEGYSRARVLVRDGARIRGYVELALLDGCFSLAALGEHIADLPAPSALIETGERPRVSVVICTRDRAALLRGALNSVLAVDYPDFDVIVVDNAPSNWDTRALVLDEFQGGTTAVHLVDEPVPGASRARNTGLRHATGEIVAFTDDDVIVDRFWLRALVAGFARGDDVACVTGLVPSGELRTAVQGFFDARVSWSRNVTPRKFTLDAPPPDSPLFPFNVGEFGTGANFAMLRRYALVLGGFDTALGVGTRTGGGEDLDIFTRVLLDGRSLVVEPAALVWHRNRSDTAALRRQAWGYGTGLGAWLTKIALQPRSAARAAARTPAAVAHLVSSVGRRPAASPATGVVLGGADRPGGAVHRTRAERQLSRIGWYELSCVARGPANYLLQRWAGEGILAPESRVSIAGDTATGGWYPNPAPVPPTGAIE